MVLVVAYYTPLSVTVPDKCDECLARQDCLAILGPLVASLSPCCLSILISALSDEQTILIGLQLGTPVAVNSPAHFHMPPRLRGQCGLVLQKVPSEG